MKLLGGIMDWNWRDMVGFTSSFAIIDTVMESLPAKLRLRNTANSIKLADNIESPNGYFFFGIIGGILSIGVSKALSHLFPEKDRKDVYSSTTEAEYKNSNFVAYVPETEDSKRKVWTKHLQCAEESNIGRGT